MRWMACVVGLAVSGMAMGQSLFRQPVYGPAPSTVRGGAGSMGEPAVKVNPVAELEGVSLFQLQPEPPRMMRVHDLVTIIVNQSSKIERDQTLETKKSAANTAQLNALPDLWKLLQLRLEAGNRTNGSPSGLPEFGLTNTNNFKGEGDYEREDRFTARVTAEVIDVKPNGLLVLEARSSIVTDKEEQTIVLSGVCRQEDVSSSNTVQSTSLSDLRLVTQHEGEVKDGASKGLITKFFETLFNF
ncbi:MAG: flagellar basal body L-ring protein FlgH [Phycisphaerales bacterium]